MSKAVFHSANSRGEADHGWLRSRHSFSFGEYYDSNRMNFGVLRVLNDDSVDPGMGFPPHSHDNMEIISIPLEGALEHKDSIGNTTIIRKGDVQIMSAGTGIRHSEYNGSNDQMVKFLQIWLLPNKKNVGPRYDQISVQEEDRLNKFLQILSPNPEDPGVWIHQNAWFYLIKLETGKMIDYNFQVPTNGVYVFVLNGHLTIENQVMNSRDGIGIWDTDKINFHAKTESDLLIMDVPM